MNTRQIVSLTNSAERMPLAKTTATSRSAGWRMWLPMTCARCVEEARHPQVRDEHHHAEEQHQGAEVDMPVGIVERGDAGGDHQRRANDGGARAIDFEERCAAESQDEVSEEEDGAGDDRQEHACGMVHRPHGVIGLTACR